MDEVFGRLHRLLIAELHGRGHSPDRPLEIAQIYDEIVPYHAVRSIIRVELAADYEHALLRLLAGEGGLLRVEPEEVREAFEQEVNQPFPIVDIFRKYPQCQVWASIPEEGADGDPEYGTAPSSDPDTMISLEDWPLPEEVRAQEQDLATNLVEELAEELAEVLSDDQADEPAAETSNVAADPASPPPAPSPDRSDPMEEDPAGAAAAGSCPFCQGELPGDRDARFCPHCGADQRKRPCAACDAVLEPEWQYCISCGQEQRR